MKKTFSKGKIAAIVVVVAVIIIPMLYSYFYLGAFWDPYSRLEKLPVAVVNNDQGAVINDKQRNAGQEMCDELKKDGSLKFVFTDEQDAKSGTDGKKYYAMIDIPKGFSADIASASTTDKKEAIVTYSSNEKRNYLASQILNRAILEVEEKTRSKINKEIVQELVDNIKDLPGQMNKLQDGLGKINDGSADLKKGADKVANGTQTYKEKFADYAKGVTKAKDGSSTMKDGAASLKDGSAYLKDGATSLYSGVTSLKDGAVTLDNGLSNLLGGVNKLTTSTKDINQLSDGAKSLAAGANNLNTGIIQYTAGVDNLIASVNTTSAFMKQLVTANPALLKDPQVAAFVTKMSDPANAKSIAELQAASTKLKAASDQISKGATMLSSNSENLPKLKEGLQTLSNGISSAKDGSAKLAAGSAKLKVGSAALADGSAKLADGSAKLADGSNSLYTGMTSLNNATSKLSTAANDIADGTEKISNGAKKLHNGTEDAKSGLDDSIISSKDDTKKLDGLAKYAKAPVTIKQENINPVPNYGTAFAPYFLSLSLWVGALIMFVILYLDADNKFGVLSRYSNKVVARSFIYLLISLAQAIVLALCVKYGLGLKVKDTFLYYASCCLVSMVFLSVVQFLMVHLKDVGKFLTILLLILQLTSCGGTFPMETLPKFYKILYPYMPMTYSVGIFKQAISGVSHSELVYNTGILVGILVVFMTLTVLISVIKLKGSKRLAATEAVEVF